MRWSAMLAVLASWAVSGYLYVRYRQLHRTAQGIADDAARLMTEATEFTRDTYRVKLSCPVCEWTDLVVRETRVAAMDEGNRRIAAHNEEEGHLLSGSPRPGYFRGEPVN
jgi:hypothetical protein